MKLKEALEKEKFVVTSEFQSPIDEDPAELIDLSQQRPILRAEMIEIWDQYAKETGVILPPGGSLSF